MRRIVLWVADPVTHFRLLDRSEAELPEAIAKAHQKAKRQILGEMHKLVEAAVLPGKPAQSTRESAPSLLLAWRCGPRGGSSPAKRSIIEEVADS